MTRVRETGTFVGSGTNAGPRCLKEYTFGTSNSGSDLRLGKVQVATWYNYPTLGIPTHTVAAAETYAYQGKEGRASKRDTQVFFNTAAVEAFTQGFTYDDLGNTASLTYPRCTHTGCAPPGAPSPKVVNFTYTEGLLTSVRDSTSFAYASSISYHSNQTVSQVVHSNGITEVIGLDPNAQQRPASILAKNAGGNLWNAGTYSYDGSGNIKSVGGSGFAYDPASRLITANLWDGTGATGTPLKTQAYGYDLFGNLQSIGGQGGRNTPTSSTTNRLNGPGMVFDAAGNQTNSPGAIHEYDPFHLMWHFQSGGEDWRYVYTADDERIWSFRTGGGLRWTLRDLGNSVLREYANNGGAWSVKEDFIHRGGQLLAADTSAGVSHFHLDHLGTPRLVTNQSGVKIAYHVYWPYGEELTSSTQDSERMKFTGHERDLNGAGGTGDDLDYMHARFCSPVTGRFLGVDAAPGDERIPQSWNRYTYALGTPLRFVDPDGLAPKVYFWKTFKFILDSTNHGGPHIDVHSIKRGGSVLLARVSRATGGLIRHMGRTGSVPSSATTYMRGRGWVPGLGIAIVGASMFFEARSADAQEDQKMAQINSTAEATGAVNGLLGSIAMDLFGGPRTVSGLSPEQLAQVHEELEKRADAQEKEDAELEKNRQKVEGSLNLLSSGSCFFTGVCPQ